MKHRAKVIAVLIGVTFGAKANVEPLRECSTHQTGASTASPKMKSPQVLALAKRTAITSKRDLAEFEEPSICFSSSSADWIVSFHDRPVNGLRVLDKHFSVFVNDRTGKVVVMPGGG